MLVQLGEAPEAELWARKALELFPGNGELLAGRAQALCRMGETRQAGAVCDAAMSAAGPVGISLAGAGRMDAGLQAKTGRPLFRQGQELDSNWLVALESALIYLHYNFPTRAVARARLATELAPAEYHPWFVRGTAEADLGLRHFGPSKVSTSACSFARGMSRPWRAAANWPPAGRPGTIWKACRNFLGRR